MYNPLLDTFISIADSGSFSKAAEKLFISPTAVIKQINILENDLGFRCLLEPIEVLKLRRLEKPFIMM